MKVTERLARLVFWAGKNYGFEALAILVLTWTCWLDREIFKAGLLTGIGGTLLGRAALEAALRPSDTE